MDTDLRFFLYGSGCGLRRARSITYLRTALGDVIFAGAGNPRTLLIGCGTMRVTWTLALLAFASFGEHAVGGVVIYHESIDGDLPFSTPIDVGTFDVGLNIVSGTAGVDGKPEIFYFTIDQDGFFFTIAEGHQLEWITISTEAAVGNVVNGGWKLNSSDLVSLIHEDVAIPEERQIFTSVMPLSHGTYHMELFSFQIPFETDDFSSYFNYTLTYSVSQVPAVPEPGTLALVGVGSVGMIGGWYRKRRKTTQAA